MRLDGVKIRWVTMLSVVIAIVIVVLLFVPVVPNSSGGTMTVCNSTGCIYNIVQYDSISYFYGGWGAYLQTGTYYYTVQGWLCSCPAEGPGQNIPCCVPPAAGIIWPLV